MSRRKTKLIYLGVVGNYSLIPSEDDDSFFMWGWGSVLGREILKRSTDYEVEVWRTEPRVKEVRSRMVQGINCHLYPCNFPLLAPNTPLSLVRALSHERQVGDIILHLDSIFTRRTYTLAMLFPDMPIVAQAHGDMRPDLAYYLNPNIRNWIKIWIISLGLKRLKHAFVLRKDDLTWVAKKTGMDRAHLVTVGVDETLFVPMEKAVGRSQIGLPASSKIICYVGFAYKLKGVDCLLKSFIRLKKEEPDLELLLVGARDTDPLYFQALDAGARVIGRVPQDQIPVFLSASDVYALPAFDPHYRGIDTSGLQALACNVPVVSPNLAHFPLDDVSSLGVPLSSPEGLTNALRSVLDNLDDYKHVRETALPYISWTGVVKRVLEVYASILEKR